MKTISKDSRDAERLRPYHQAARRTPWLQKPWVGWMPVLFLLARLRIVGRDRLPKGGFIVAPNHPSMADPFFLAVALRGRLLAAMGKSTLFKGLAGWALGRFGAFPVRRGTWDTDAFETAGAVLEDGRALMLFPEGTTVPPGAERRVAKPGIGFVAATCGATIVPVYLKGTEQMLSRPWSRPRVTVVFGEPFTVEPDAQPSRDLTQQVADETLERIYALADEA